jgi:peptidoglycan/xylan/chitin deacetylase (PgdA/CDA1 family)
MKSLKIKPSRIVDDEKPAQPLFITFDDGGRSAYTHIAPQLEKQNWLGHFFIATDYIDTPTFLSSDEIRELNKRGHVVGSHSASHPLRFAACSQDEMLREWRVSIERLSDILQEKVSVASIPGGLYSKQVAETASRAGIKKLFTSEPTTKTWQVEETICFGRYTIQRQTSAETVAAIARGEITPRLQQFLFWNAKKVVKTLGGGAYLKFRERLLAKN